MKTVQTTSSGPQKQGLLAEDVRSGDRVRIYRSQKNGRTTVFRAQVNQVHKDNGLIYSIVVQRSPNNGGLKRQPVEDVRSGDSVKIYRQQQIKENQGKPEPVFRGKVVKINKNNGLIVSAAVRRLIADKTLKNDSFLNSPVIFRVENFQSKLQTTGLRGIIGAGKGIAQDRLGSVKNLDEKLGYVHVEGTLNVRLYENPRLSIEKAPIKIAGHGLWPITINGKRGHIIRWSNDERDTSVEVISDTHLRSSLGLEDRDKVDIKFLKY